MYLVVEGFWNMKPVILDGLGGDIVRLHKARIGNGLYVV